MIEKAEGRIKVKITNLKTSTKRVGAITREVRTIMDRISSIKNSIIKGISKTKISKANLLKKTTKELISKKAEEVEAEEEDNTKSPNTMAQGIE